MRILTRLFAVALLALIPTIGLVTPVLATEPEPDTVTLTDIEVFNSLLTDNDTLAFVPYYIAFSPDNPSESLDKTFIFRLLSTDGLTEYGTTLASTDFNSGYGNGVVSFYLSSGLTLGEAYTFRVQENPVYYPSAQYWDFTIGAANYSEDDDQAAALRAKVIDSATFLTPVFEVSLLDMSESGATILSTYGEIYYLNVIPGLQNMCRSLFSVDLETPDFTKRTWSTTFAEDLKTKYEGTFIYDFMTGFAGLFSIETSPAMNFLSAVMFVALVIVGVWKFKATPMSSLLDGYCLLLLLMLNGFFSMIWAGFIAFVSAVIGGVVIFLKRA